MKALSPKFSLIRSVILVSLFAVGVVGILKMDPAHGKTPAKACTVLKTVSDPRDLFPLAQLSGKAAYIHDFTDEKEIYAKNAFVALPLASITKLMTVRIALKDRDPKSTYTLSVDDLNTFGTPGLFPGERFTLGDLAAAALIPSSNDAATALAHSRGISLSAFYTAMNDEAASLHLQSLNFKSATGLDSSSMVASSVGSARDVTMLLHEDIQDFPAIMGLSIQPETTLHSLDGDVVTLSNTNQIGTHLKTLQASKTGYTKAAGGNLTIAWRDDATGHNLGATILGSSETGRFSDIELLHDAGNAYVEHSSKEVAPCE